MSPLGLPGSDLGAWASLPWGIGLHRLGGLDLLRFGRGRCALRGLGWRWGAGYRSRRIPRWSRAPRRRPRGSGPADRAPRAERCGPSSPSGEGESSPPLTSKIPRTTRVASRTPPSSGGRAGSESGRRRLGPWERCRRTEAARWRRSRRGQWVRWTRQAPRAPAKRIAAGGRDRRHRGARGGPLGRAAGGRPWPPGHPCAGEEIRAHRGVLAAHDLRREIVARPDHESGARQPGRGLGLGDQPQCPRSFKIVVAMRTGDELDGWRLARRLGAGSNASVCEAHRGDHGKNALKTLRPGAYRREERFRCFQREVKALETTGDRLGILPLLDANLDKAPGSPPGLPCQFRSGWRRAPRAGVYGPIFCLGP